MVPVAPPSGMRFYHNVKYFFLEDCEQKSNGHSSYSWTHCLVLLLKSQEPCGKVQIGRKEGGNKGQERQVVTPYPDRDKKRGWGLREANQVPGRSLAEWTKQARIKGDLLALG